MGNFRQSLSRIRRQLITLMVAAEWFGLLNHLARLAIALMPDRFETYQALGSALQRTGQLSKAVSVWAEGMAAQQRAARRSQVSPSVRYLARSWTVAIGHHALVDVIAKRQVLGLSPADRYVIICRNREAANFSYLQIWKNWFEIVTEAQEIDRLADQIRLAEDYLTVLAYGKEWRWFHEVMHRVQEQWEASGCGPLLTLPAEYEERGRDALAIFGMPSDAWFVTLHIREGSRSVRNTNRDDYLQAMQKITDAGGWVVRIGGPLSPPLPAMERVVDYASFSQRAEMLDVFLMARARFFLGTNSGPAWVAGTFGVPAVLTNWAPLGIMSTYESITVPRLLWVDRDRRLLTFAEQLAEPFGFIESVRHLRRFGVSQVDNSPSEISEAVDEMLQKTAGAWTKDVEDLKRQQRFRELQRRFNATGRSSIGSSFLRRNAALLN